MSQTWHFAVLVGGATSDFGTLTYAPGGSAFVQYSILGGSNWALWNAVQTGTTFAASTAISTNGRTASLFFVDANNIWASVETAFQLHIYKSTDAGATWSLQKSNSLLFNGASSAVWDRSRWVDLGGGDLEVFFGTSYYNAVFGEHPEVHSLSYTSGAWAASDVTVNLATNGTMIEALRSGSDYLVSNGNVNFSQDGGSTYTEEQSGSTLDQDIIQTGGVALAAGTLYSVNPYAYGVSGSQYHFGIWKSTDFGKTWTKVYASPGAAYSYDFSSIAAVGSLIVAEVVQEASNGSGSPQLIQFVASADGGATWTAPAQIIDIASLGNYHVVALQLAASSNGRIGAVYSLEPGATGSGGTGGGVYFSEFY